MYFGALTRGLAPVPEPGEDARAEARALVARHGPAWLHARLAEQDPGTAGGLRPLDSQRVARAWEVWRGTGRGLAAWQAETTGAVPGRYRMILLDPPRAELRAAIGVRFAAMLAQGALDEVWALVALGLDPDLPAMRAHGVPELAAVLDGTIGLEEAGRRAVLATGQYTKRQATWFRHRAPVEPAHMHTIHARIAGPEQFSESLWKVIEGFISETCREQAGEA